MSSRECTKLEQAIGDARSAIEQVRTAFSNVPSASATPSTAPSSPYLVSSEPHRASDTVLKQSLYQRRDERPPARARAGSPRCANGRRGGPPSGVAGFTGAGAELAPAAPASPLAARGAAFAPPTRTRPPWGSRTGWTTVAKAEPTARVSRSPSRDIRPSQQARQLCQGGGKTQSRKIPPPSAAPSSSARPPAPVSATGNSKRPTGTSPDRKFRTGTSPEPRRTVGTSRRTGISPRGTSPRGTSPRGASPDRNPAGASPDRRAEADARAYGADRGADLAPPYDEWQTNGYRDPRNVERDAAALLAVASQMQELFQCQDTLLKASQTSSHPRTRRNYEQSRMRHWPKCR